MVPFDERRDAEVLKAFDDIVELDTAARAARLVEIGSSDPSLLSALGKLLDADAESSSRLARIDRAFGYTELSDDESETHDPLQLLGRTFSHFRVDARIARGGMSVVYRAEDTRLQRPVALKFPLPAHHFDREMRERFLREARIVGTLDHPNICSVYEAGETDTGELFLAMPCYDGETLKARLAHAGRLAIAETLQIARQIVEGLRAAHLAGIVHRDLKPANVMLLPDGSVKILDFGLAKVTDPGLTRSRARLGTAGYMSPEQVQGLPIDQRTDLWSLGVVLYEMIAGRRPFEGDHDVTVAHAIVHAAPPALATLCAKVSPKFEDIILKLLCKDPDGRYANVEDLAAALNAIELQHQPLEARVSKKRWDLNRNWASKRLRYTTLVLVLLAASGAWIVTRESVSTTSPRTLAVLPFTNLTADANDDYLAVGLADAIRARLSRVHTIMLPSYTSTSVYQANTKPPEQVAGELRVASVLMGNMRRAGDRIRIDLELFDSTNARQLWRRSYDRPLAEAALLERDVARDVMRGLRIQRTRAEAELLSVPTTQNARAYDAYMRGRYAELRNVARHIFATLRVDDIREAQSLYAQARDLDPNFAVARAHLARMLMFGAAAFDTMHARREHAKLEAEAALRLQPNLAEARHALARYWNWRGLDVNKAIAELEVGLRAAPHSLDLYMTLGEIYREAGRWEDAVNAYDRAMQIEPANPRAFTRAAITQLRLRRDADAMRAFDRAIELTPDDHMLKVIKGHTFLRWKGTPDTLDAALRSVPREWDPNGMATWARYTVLRVQRRLKDALVMLDSSRTKLSRDGLVYQPAALMRAQVYDELGQHGLARTQYQNAVMLLSDSSRAHPDNASIRAALGLAYAGLGRKAEAIREARGAIGLVPLSRSSTSTTAFMGIAVEIFGRVGDLDTAFELLELLLAMPAGREVTVAFLRVWPGFDSLRSDPRFGKLLDRFPVD